MSARRHKTYPQLDTEPLVVSSMNRDEIEAWRARATELRRTTDMSVRQIAREIGRGFGPVQRFLNPDSARKQKIAQAEYTMARRKNDPEYAERSRTYVRQYMQLRAPERWKNT